MSTTAMTDLGVKELLPHLFKRPIAFHRILAEVSGSVNGGVFLSQAMYWSNITKSPEGWFYKTAEDWQGETFLSRREQETVRVALKKLGILEEQRKGIPAKLYFRVDMEVLAERLQKIAQNNSNSRHNSSMAESAILCSTNDENSSVGKRTSITESTTESTSKTTKDISYDEDFGEFWSTYPKRPNNSKAAAKKKYIAARKRGVPHVIIMAGLRDYAAMRNKAVANGDSPTFTQMAETWLNKEGWETDYSEPVSTVSKPKLSVPAASDEQMAAITAVYKGPSGDLDRAKVVLAAELAKGIELKKIVEAAQKYALYVKQMRQNGVDMAATTLDTWLKFKWREMDAYYIYRNPVERYPVLKPVKVKT